MKERMLAERSHTVSPSPVRLGAQLPRSGVVLHECQCVIQARHLHDQAKDGARAKGKGCVAFAETSMKTNT